MPKPTVFHFRNTFLRASETFIARIVHNHIRYKPLAVGLRGDDYLQGIDAEIYSGPKIALAKDALQFSIGNSPSHLSRIVEKYNPKVIHSHFGQDAYIMVPTARQHQLPHLVSFYGKDVTQLPKQRIWRHRYKSVMKGSTLVVAASNKMKGQLVELGFDAEKIRIVRFGVDMTKFEWKPKESDSNRLILIGRFVEKKGMEYAIKAIPLLLEEFPDLSLDIYGEGTLGASLKKLVADLGVSEHVSIFGFVPNNDVSALMQEYDVLLVPSVTASNNDQEGLPNVIIEGMASGVAVVASRHAAIPEIVIDGETGFISEEREPQTIADAVKRLLADSSLKRRIMHDALEFVRREHDLEKTVSDLEVLYDEASERVASL